jgi:HisJ family histidinol phosphate phosphatase
MNDPRLAAIPDIHGHAKGEHKPYVEERPIPYSARMLFLWFFHAARRGQPRFMMVADHINYLTFEDPAAVNLVRRALKLAAAGDLYGAAETAGVDLVHAAVVSEGLRRGMRYSIGAEVDNDPRARPDAQNIVDAMKPDGLIRSVHFLTIEHPVHGAGWQWAFDNPEFVSLYETVGAERVWELYVTALLDSVEKLPGNIVGHFYAPAKFGHWPEDAKLEEYEDRLIAACRERGMAIEVNTRFLYRYLEDDEQRRRYLAANLRLLRKAKAEGVGVAIGSDAHSPKDQGMDFEQVLDLLDAAEINEIVFPIGGRLARVALRATREHLEQQAAAAAASVAEAAGALEPVGTAGAARDDGPPATEPAAGSLVAHDGKPRRPSRARAAVSAAARQTETPAKTERPARASASASRAPRPKPQPAPAKTAAPPKAAAKDAKPVKAAKPAPSAAPSKPRAKPAAKSAKPATARPAQKKAAPAARPSKRGRAAPAPAKRVRPVRAAAKPAAKPKAKPAAKAAPSRPRKRPVAKAAVRKTAPKKAQAKKKHSKSRR